MPNTLAHIAVNGITSRALGVSADLKWVYAGVVLPDLPWILNRIIGAGGLGLDPVYSRSFFIIQSSFLLCILLSVCFASASRRFGPTFIALALGSFLHLLLDGMQTKWGNGVVFIGPLDWSPVNFGLFWPESMPTLALTVAGLVFFLASIPRLRKNASVYRGPRRVRAAPMALAGIAYFLLPLALIGGPIKADAHFLGTIQDRAERAGKYIELDRARCSSDGGETIVRLLTGEPVRVLGMPDECKSAASIKGEFLAPDVIKAEAVHLHAATLRDGASYVGLLLILIWWVLTMSRDFDWRRDKQ